MVRLAKQPKPEPEPQQPDEENVGPDPTKDEEKEPKQPVPRGMTERQWVISLLVAAGLLLLITFRGCILPSGVGPKAKPPPKPSGTPQPTVQPTTGTEYTVQGGDTLSKIAGKFGVTVEALAQANNIDLNRPVILQVGQKLKIPPAGSQAK